MYSSRIAEDNARHEAARDSGLEAVGHIPWGTHFCQFHSGKNDLLETIVPYMKAGLEANELCLWIISDVLDIREAEDALNGAIPEFGRYLEEERIEIVHSSQWYGSDGSFDADNMLESAANILDAALSRGFEGLRATGDLSWQGREGWKEFVRYECSLDCSVSSKPMLVLCTYPLGKCGPREIIDAAANHEFALIRGADGWELLENTARRRIEREYKKFVSLAGNSSEFIGICGMDFEPSYINAAGLRMVGLDNIAQLQETLAGALFFPEDHQFLRDEFLPRIFAEERAESVIRFRHFKTGAPLWMICNVFFLKGDNGEPMGLATVSRNITEHKLAEDAARWNAQRNELLSSVAARLLRTRNANAEVEELCRKVMTFLNCDVFFNFLVDGKEKRLCLNAFAGVSPEQVRSMETIGFGTTICGTVARDRYRIIAEYISSSDSPLTATIKSFGVEAYCCHPLMAQDRVIGTLAFGTRTRQRFSSREIQVMAAVADLVAMAMNRIQTEKALCESERQLRQLGDSLPDSAVYRYGHEPDGSPRYYYLSAGIEQLNGVRSDDVLRDAGTLHRQVLPEYLPRLIEGERRSARELSDFEIEVPMRRTDGKIRWMRLKSRPQKMPDGRVVWDGVQTDITARKNMQETLRVSEERLRAIVGTAMDGIIVIDTQGDIQSINPAAEQMFGYTSAEAAGQSIAMFMPEPYRLRHRLRVSASFNNPVAPRFQQVEVEGLRRDGSTFPAELSVAPWDAGGERYFTGIIRDVTQRKRREEKINVLLREVNHRSKNMLSLVQAIASQTAARDPAEFVRHFSERIRALAASQDLLVKSQWQGISIEELVKSQLAYFRDLLGSRIELGGPPLRIAAPAAQSIGMALHELATNAGKYGALSTSAGRIAIGWSLGGGPSGKPRFGLRWTESGGPAVSVPKRTGFGSIVVDTMPRMELDASVELQYAPEGLRWHLDCPAEAVLEAGDDPSAFRMIAQ
jgi:PAS domain S-box-containing protein